MVVTQFVFMIFLRTGFLLYINTNGCQRDRHGSPRAHTLSARSFSLYGPFGTYIKYRPTRNLFLLEIIDFPSTWVSGVDFYKMKKCRCSPCNQAGVVPTRPAAANQQDQHALFGPPTEQSQATLAHLHRLGQPFNHLLNSEVRSELRSLSCTSQSWRQNSSMQLLHVS